MQEYAANVGWYDRYKNSAWILTDYDVWVPNPHYEGPTRCHPEVECEVCASGGIHPVITLQEFVESHADDSEVPF
jgi:hypothetical protein